MTLTRQRRIFRPPACELAQSPLKNAILSPALSTITFLGLSGDAGAEVSGRPARRDAAPQPTGGGA